MEALLLKTEAGRYYKVSDGFYTRSIERNDTSKWDWKVRYFSLTAINPDTREKVEISLSEIPNYIGSQLLFANFSQFQRTSPIVSVEEYKEAE